MHVEEILHRWVTEVFPWIHMKRRSAMEALISAVFYGGRLTVTGLGRSIRSTAKEKHNIKRADRLLSNKPLQSDLREIYRALAHRIIGQTQRPVVLVDWSDIDKGQKFFLLRASTPVKGRSLTLYEEVHSVSTKEKPKTHREFLKALKHILPLECCPIVVTDAGFRTPWFETVQQLGWDYVGRIRNREKVQIQGKTHWIPAKLLYRQASANPKSFTDICLTVRNSFRSHLVLFKRKPRGRVRKTRFGNRARCIKNVRNAAREREPWLLATSLQPKTITKRIVSVYASRMQIEEAFRDIKSARCGFSLEYSGTYLIKRLAVLILLGSLAATFAWILGKATELAGNHRMFQANSINYKSVLSATFIGVQVFKNAQSKIPRILLRKAHNLLLGTVRLFAYEL